VQLGCLWIQDGFQQIMDQLSHAKLVVICSEKMETLLWEIEKVAEKILLALWESSQRRSICGNDMIQGQEVGSVCCLYKHSRNVPADRWYDVIRMLIRGTDFSHALCLHVCAGASEFHVYSKKGWVSFIPDKGALIITAGDQIQVNFDAVFAWLKL
jgi:hypothetical protein